MTILAPGKAAVIPHTEADNSAAQQPQTDDQKRLKHLISRRHPQYEETVNHWRFLESTYEGGIAWFKDNVFRYIKEGDKDYEDRVERAYRFNHSREVVDLINKYLFKQEIRRAEDAPEPVRTFWKRATKNGMNIRDLVKQAGKKASMVGRIAVVVDTTHTGAGALSVAEAKKLKIRTYAYSVGPEDLLDYAWDEEGELDWILIRECARDDADPFTSSGDERDRFRLWTKNNWSLYEERLEGRRKVVRKVGEGTHNLGVVPVILHDHIITDEMYKAPALIDDIAYLDRAVANYLSNLDAIIQDQTFSQLAMPAQNVLPGEDNYNKLVDMGTKRIFLYDGEGGARPEYLSPDPRQAGMILSVVNKIISEIYHTVGMAGERTKQDNAVGIDNSSGVAKAYDFERVNALLTAKADSLEVLENKLARLVAKWNGVELAEDVVRYPDNFDTRGLYDEFDIAARLMLIDAPDQVRREQMRTLMDKLFPMLKKELREKMESELKDWPVDPVELAAQLAVANASGPVTSTQSQKAGGSAGANTPTPAGGAGKKPQADKRQGQVTKGTK